MSFIQIHLFRIKPSARVHETKHVSPNMLVILYFNSKNADILNMLNIQ